MNVFVKDHSCADSIEKLYYYDFISLFVSIVHQKLQTQLTLISFHSANSACTWSM